MTGEEFAQSAANRVSRVQVQGVLSVERMLYALVLLIAVSLRLWSLGTQPLSPWEASNSWPAWLVAHGLNVEGTPSPTSALFYGVQWLLFWTGVNSDAGARFVSALAGSVLVVLPWWWRGVLGRGVALLAAFLLAIDAWLLAFSRLADGASLAITLALFCIIAISQTVEKPTAIFWQRALAISAGLLVVAGPMAWNLLPVVALWGWLNFAGLRIAGALQRRWLVWLGGAAFVGATMWFARLDGLAWIASGMSVWLAQVDGRSAGPLLPEIAGGYELGWPWLRLLIDAPLLLPLGVGGLIVLTVRGDNHHVAAGLRQKLLWFCIGWLLWGLLLWLLPGRNALVLPVVGLPLLILAAFALDILVRYVPRNLDWREASAVVLTLTILFVSGTLWLTGLFANRNFDPVLAQAALVIFVLAIAILVAFGLWANRRDAAWVAATLFSILLLVVALRSSWRLSYGNVLSEPAGWQAEQAHPELRLLAQDIETLSSHRTGDPFQLPVQVQVAAYLNFNGITVPARPDPTIGWELRNMRNVTWVSAPTVAEDSLPLPLVLTPAGEGDEPLMLDLPSVYAGSRYHVDRWWLPRSLGAATVVAVEGENQWLREMAGAFQPWWRWAIYREPTQPPLDRDIILWAPLDELAP